jgi:FAD/FMN-containing dehydrogenase
VRRSDSDYDEVKGLFNPQFDRAQPLAVIEAAHADDVAEAIRFGQRFGLRSRPRSGGHSYVGASTVDDGLMIDVRRMRRVGYDAASGIATVGAGAQLYATHAALAVHSRSIPTGTCPTVGAAGLTLGGGVGIDSRRHGLTCDALTRLTMVTADGKVRQIDGDRHRDLWWASRGGGGGNFGVVTSFRYATHAARPMGVFLLSFPWGVAPAVLRGWARRISVMPRSVWCNVKLEASSDGSTRVRVGGACTAGDQEAQAAAFERAVGVDATSVSTFEQSFMDGVRFFGGGSTSARTAFAAGSDVVESMSPDLSRRLAQVITRRAADGGSGVVILDPLTGAVSDPAVGATAFPWRRHVADLQWYVGLPLRPTLMQVRAAQAWISGAHRAVSSASVGAYVNYVEPGRRIGAYYGPNLGRLRRVKAAVDPSGFFRSAYTV